MDTVRPAVILERVDVGYGGAPVLRGCSLTIPAGAVTAVVGANGCGKSTLLRAVAGLQPCAAGQIRLGDRDLRRWRGRALAREVAFLPQAPATPAGVTVRELVSYGRFPHRGLLGGDSGADRDAIGWALATTGLEAVAGTPV